MNKSYQTSVKNDSGRVVAAFSHNPLGTQKRVKKFLSAGKSVADKIFWQQHCQNKSYRQYSSGEFSVIAGQR